MWRNLDRYDVPKPCPMSWDSMTGTAQVRHCRPCGKDIHNLSALTGKEIKSLVARHQGEQLCVALTRDAQGRIVTLDQPARVRLSKCFAKITGAVLATLLGITPGLAQPKKNTVPVTRLAQTPNQSLIQIEPRRKTGKTLLQGKVTTNNQPIKGAKVILFHKNGWHVYNTKTNKNGTFRLTGLRSGAYTLQITADGYSSFSQEISFEKGGNLNVDVAMSFPGVVGTVAIRATPLEFLLNVVKLPYKALKKIFR